MLRFGIIIFLFVQGGTFICFFSNYLRGFGYAKKNYNFGSSALVVYIWMHYTSKNISHNSTFFNSKSATHETFVIGKFMFRICHEFLMLLRGQTAGTLSRYLCHLFPRIITRYSTCRGLNFEALFAVKSNLILSSTGRLNWRFCVGKLLFPSQCSRSPAT